MAKRRYFKATFADGTTIVRGSPTHVYAKASRYENYNSFHRSADAALYAHCLEVVPCVEIDAKEFETLIDKNRRRS